MANIMLQELSQAFAEAGWIVNAQKTEWVGTRIPLRSRPVLLNGVPCTKMQPESAMRWLGVWFNSNGRPTGAWKITRQRTLASWMFWRPVLCSGANFQNRVALLNATVGAVATWAAEFWTPSYTTFERIAALQRHLLSKMIRLRRKPQEFFSGWYRRRLRAAGELQRTGPALPWNVIALTKFWKFVRGACYWQRDCGSFRCFWDFGPADQLTLQLVGVTQRGRGRGPNHRKGRPSGWLESLAQWGMEMLGEPWYVHCRASTETEWRSLMPKFWAWIHRKRPEAEQLRLLRLLVPGALEIPPLRHWDSL